MPKYEVRWNEYIYEYRQKNWAGIGITFGDKAYLVEEIDGDKGLIIMRYGNYPFFTPVKEWRTFKKIVSFFEWHKDYRKDKKAEWVHYAPLFDGWKPKRDENGKTTLCGKTAIRINCASKKSVITCPRCKEILENQNE